MAKDTREIHSNVILPADTTGQKVKGLVTTSFGPGMEDELEAVLTPEQCEHLIEQGAISGNWHPKGDATADAPDDVPRKRGRPRKAAAPADGDDEAADDTPDSSE